MNVLPPRKRREIVGLWAAGATIREIASAVGCSKEAAHRNLGEFSGRRRLRMTALVERVMDWIDERLGTDGEWAECDALCELSHMTRFSCPIHPEADPDDMLESNGTCGMCRSDGLRRHHARRRSASAVQRPSDACAERPPV